MHAKCFSTKPLHVSDENDQEELQECTSDEDADGYGNIDMKLSRNSLLHVCLG